MFDTPTITDFKTLFFRDFNYGGTNGDLTTVQDQDLTNALADAGTNFNSLLFSTQADYSNSYLLLSAHFLVMNLRASSQGIAGQYNWLQSGKGVGGISESFSIPNDVAQIPEFASYSKTFYGQKYLMIVLPRLRGQIFTVCGEAHP
jgi:hypothetical protein